MGIASDSSIPFARESDGTVALFIRLLVNSFWLWFGKEFLKTGIVTDWVPDGVDLQTRNRNVFSGRDCEQLPKYFYRLLGLASVRFDLRLVRQENSCREPHLFLLASTLPLLARREAHRRYVRGKRKSRLTPIPKCGLLAAVWLVGLRVKHVLPRTPVLLPHFDRQAVESQFAPLAALAVLRLC